MMKIFSIFGVIIGLALVIAGIATTTPDDIIRTGVLHTDNRDRGGYQRYVGGDAYNFIIESSIRGGEIAGSNSARATYLTGGLMLIAGSFIALGASLDKEKKMIEQQKVFVNTEETSQDGIEQALVNPIADSVESSMV